MNNHPIKQRQNAVATVLYNSGNISLDLLKKQFDGKKGYHPILLERNLVISECIRQRYPALTQDNYIYILSLYASLYSQLHDPLNDIIDNQGCINQIVAYQIIGIKKINIKQPNTLLDNLNKVHLFQGLMFHIQSYKKAQGDFAMYKRQINDAVKERYLLSVLPKDDKVAEKIFRELQNANTAHTSALDDLCRYYTKRKFKKQDIIWMEKNLGALVKLLQEISKDYIERQENTENSKRKNRFDNKDELTINKKIFLNVQQQQSLEINQNPSNNNLVSQVQANIVNQNIKSDIDNSKNNNLNLSDNDPIVNNQNPSNNNVLPQVEANGGNQNIHSNIDNSKNNNLNLSHDDSILSDIILNQGFYQLSDSINLSNASTNHRNLSDNDPIVNNQNPSNNNVLPQVEANGGNQNIHSNIDNSKNNNQNNPIVNNQNPSNNNLVSQVQANGRNQNIQSNIPNSNNNNQNNPIVNNQNPSNNNLVSQVQANGRNQNIQSNIPNSNNNNQNNPIVNNQNPSNNNLVSQVQANGRNQNIQSNIPNSNNNNQNNPIVNNQNPSNNNLVSQVQANGRNQNIQSNIPNSNNNNQNNPIVNNQNPSNNNLSIQKKSKTTKTKQKIANDLFAAYQNSRAKTTEEFLKDYFKNNKYDEALKKEVRQLFIRLQKSETERIQNICFNIYKAYKTSDRSRTKNESMEDYFEKNKVSPEIIAEVKKLLLDIKTIKEERKLKQINDGRPLKQKHTLPINNQRLNSTQQSHINYIIFIYIQCKGDTDKVKALVSQSFNETQLTPIMTALETTFKDREITQCDADVFHGLVELFFSNLKMDAVETVNSKKKEQKFTDKVFERKERGANRNI